MCESLDDDCAVGEAEAEWDGMAPYSMPSNSTSPLPTPVSDIGRQLRRHSLQSTGSMNGSSSVPTARPRSSGGSISNATTGPCTTSPRSSKGKPRTPKRRHDQTEAGSSSAESAEEAVDGRGEKRRQPGVKRACNECRQQKLKCDVTTDPVYLPCERCRRLKLECKIDSNFKRVGKRSRHAEMEREIEDLKRQLASYQLPTSIPRIKAEGSADYTQISQMDTFMGSEDAVASLMDLASGHEGGSFMRSPNARLLMSRRLHDVVVTQDQVHELFQIYFSCYHPFLPILENSQTPDEFYESSKLLFWVIISVAARRYHTRSTLLRELGPQITRLLWEQVAEVPQTYLFVKALCVLCTWPLPISSTSSDPTFMLSGLNMHVAMQIGLHRPSHVQDFQKFKAELIEDELRDRVRTWASCNAVAQRVATGYGQPPSTFYDWTLEPSGIVDPGFVLPKDAQNRLLIERFSSRVTEALYRNDNDPVGLASDDNRSSFVKILARDYDDVERRVRQPDAFTFLYLRATGLHLRLSIFFASSSSKDYNEGLLALFNATTAFLEAVFAIQSDLLPYATNYVLQMIIASAFALLKLLNSFFAAYIDLDYGRRLFTKTIRTIRTISVLGNDLPGRLAEVLSQLWRSSGAASKRPEPTSSVADNSLQLKVRCRMSMSLVFDSVWRWREEFQAQGRGNLEAALKNPTNPDLIIESSSTSVADHSLTPSIAPGEVNTITPESFGINESYNEVFDPLNWMFDGLVEWPSYGLPGIPDVEG